MKYDKMLMLLTLVAAGLAAGCSDDEDPLKDWTGPSKPGTEIKTPAEVGNRVVAHRGGSTEAGTRQFPDNSVAVGVPARVIKTIRDDQLAHNIENAKAYVEMGRQHAALVSP